MHLCISRRGRCGARRRFQALAHVHLTRLVSRSLLPRGRGQAACWCGRWTGCGRCARSHCPAARAPSPMCSGSRTHGTSWPSSTRRPRSSCGTPPRPQRCEACRTLGRERGHPPYQPLPGRFGSVLFVLAHVWSREFHSDLSQLAFDPFDRANCCALTIDGHMWRISGTRAWPAAVSFFAPPPLRKRGAREVPCHRRGGRHRKRADGQGCRGAPVPAWRCRPHPARHGRPNNAHAVASMTTL